MRSDEHTVVWQGWDITKQRSDSGELNMEKDIGEDFKLNFKTFVNDETNPRELNERELEFGYKLKGDKQLKMRLKEKEELLSVEQRMKF